MILRVPKTVFVPFEWRGRNWDGTRWADAWVKRDDLPRFKEPEEAAQYLLNNPQIGFRDGKRVLLQWREHNEYALINEYLAGVGTPEQLCQKKH